MCPFPKSNCPPLSSRCPAVPFKGGCSEYTIMAAGAAETGSGTGTLSSRCCYVSVLCFLSLILGATFSLQSGLWASCFSLV